MYKFLSKTWSYFMGFKDCILIVTAILSLLFALGRILVKNGDLTANDIVGFVAEEKEEPVKKKTKKQKMGFHIVEN